MGKSELRRLASEALGRRLYKGRRGKGYFPAQYLRSLISEARVARGANVLQDCFGFNRRVKKVEIDVDHYRGLFRVRSVSVYQENGYQFCSCNGGPHPAAFRDEIEARVKTCYTDPEWLNYVEAIEDPETREMHRRRIAAVNEGRPVTDTVGFLLPEFDWPSVPRDRDSLVQE